MPKGSKTCPSCSKLCGPRSFSCKHCGADFIVKGAVKTTKAKVVRKKKPKIARVIDWTSLPLGTRFKVAGGSGPYWTRGDERSYITEKGFYNVHSILKDGIMGVNEHGTFNFVYMGDTVASPNVPGLTRAPHRIYVKSLGN